MTTLQERREWIQAGCPVKPEGDHHIYVLHVRPQSGVIGVACLGCKETYGYMQVWQSPAATQREDHPEVCGYIKALEDLCAWMEEHGSMERHTAQLAIVQGKNKNNQSDEDRGTGILIYRWMADLMDGVVETDRGPKRAIKSECGRFLFIFDHHARRDP